MLLTIHVRVNGFTSETEIRVNEEAFCAFASIYQRLRHVWFVSYDIR